MYGNPLGSGTTLGGSAAASAVGAFPVTDDTMILMSPPPPPSPSRGRARGDDIPAVDGTSLEPQVAMLPGVNA